MMKRLFLSLAAVAMMAMPAAALTTQQLHKELEGMKCGQTCTTKTPGSSTTKNPDIVTSTEVLVSPATSQDAPDTSRQSFDHCPPMRTMNGGWQVRTNVNADCTPLSLNPGSGGFPAVFQTVTTTTPGGVTVTPTCTTLTKTPIYNGPQVSRELEWSIDSSTSTSDGAC